MVFFDTYKNNRNKMLQVLEAMGVAVLDENKRPELSEIFKSFHAAAVFMAPLAVQNPLGQWSLKNADEPPALIEAMRATEPTGRPILLVGKTNPTTGKPFTESEQKSILAHEIFHFFQFLHGLPFTYGDQSIMGAAAKEQKALLNRVAVKRFSKDYWTFWLMDAVRAQWFRVNAKFRHPATDALYPDMQVRLVFQRELEAHRFIGRHGRTIGLPLWKTWWDNWVFQRVYRRLFDLSYSFQETTRPAMNRFSEYKILVTEKLFPGMGSV